MRTTTSFPPLSIHQVPCLPSPHRHFPDPIDGAPGASSHPLQSLQFHAQVLRSRVAVRNFTEFGAVWEEIARFGAPGYMATTVALQVGLCPTSNFSASQIRPNASPSFKVPAIFPALKCKERTGLLRWMETRVSPVVVGAASRSFDSFDSETSTSDWEGEEFTVEMSPQSWEEQRGDPQAGGLVLSSSSTSLQTLSKDVALGIVLQAAGSSTGWTTGSGLEGPSYSMEMAGNEMPGPIFSKSPRRRMRVAFTCNVCGHRTTRAINPHAYTDGTVFVQCGGCDVFHKLVDNLKLFHELRGRIYRGYECFEVGFDQPYDFLG